MGRRISKYVWQSVNHDWLKCLFLEKTLHISYFSVLLLKMCRCIYSASATITTSSQETADRIYIVNFSYSMAYVILFFKVKNSHLKQSFNQYRICTRNPRKALIFHFHVDNRMYTHHTYMYSYSKAPYAGYQWSRIVATLVCIDELSEAMDRVPSSDQDIRQICWTWYIAGYFMDTAKTINLTRLCILLNNTVVFFNHTRIKPC